MLHFSSPRTMGCYSRPATISKCSSAPSTSTYLYRNSFQCHSTSFDARSANMSPPVLGLSTRLQYRLQQLPPININIHFNTFACFSSLPLELRYQIWGHATMQPRRIKLFLGWPLKPDILDRADPFSSQTHHPSIMDVSRGARGEGGRYYKLCTQKNWRDVAVPSSIANGLELVRASYHDSCQLYINFAIDLFSAALPTFNSINDWYDVQGTNFEASTLDQIQHLEFTDPAHW